MKNQSLALLLMFSLFVFACKKEETKPSTPSTPSDCMIIQEMNDDGSQVYYVFDDNNRLLKTIYSDTAGVPTEVNYVYTGNTVTAEQANITYVYHLNANGFADTVNLEIMGGLGEINVYVQRNSNGDAIKQIVEGSVFGQEISQTATFEYLNGNMVKSTTDDGTDVTVATMTYYTEHENKSKTFEEKPSLLKGNKNLLKSTTVDGVPSDSYTYELDAQGKVTKETISTPGEDDVFVVNTWKCK